MNKKTSGDIIKLVKRLKTYLMIGVCFTVLFICLNTYFTNLEIEEGAINNKLNGITSTLSKVIDGDAHEQLFNQYPNKDDIKTNVQDSNYRKIQHTLSEVYRINKLKTAIYTLVCDTSERLEKPIFRFGVASSDEPFFKHVYELYPNEILEQYYTGGILSNYADENGSWISSWSPVLNSHNQVVCIVQADYPFDDFLVDARKKLFKRLLILLIPVLLIFYFINKVASSLINREDVISDLNSLVKIKTSLLKETEKAKKQTEIHMKAKEQFLANMSHEIRTPINGIDGMARLLAGTPLNEEQKEYIAAIRTSADNLLVIINDILDVSKIEAGKLTIEKVGFNLKDSLIHAAKTIHYRAEEKGILLETKMDDSLPEIIISDPTRLNQVIINLLSNAIKFTSEGGVTLHCSVVHKSEEKATLKFEIIDTGIGIDEKKMETIFENFSQEDDSTTREYGGTGLGLTISRQLVALLNGELKVKSEKGKGSTFYFTVEFAIGTQADVPQKNNPVLSLESLKNKKVLLAEDNQINQLLAITLLKKWKMEVDVVDNGKKSVDKLREGKYDVVLMDMQMPVMGGLEATKIIRNELKSDIPIIALTASAIKGVREECIAAGMDDYISKPFDHSELFNIMLNAINYGRNTTSV